MSRPKPRTLLQYTNKKSYKMEEVLDATAIYAVFYDGKPSISNHHQSFQTILVPSTKKFHFQIQDMLTIWLKN